MKQRGNSKQIKKNREAEITRKRALEEEEMREAAKNRKLIAESSVQLSNTLGSALDLVTGLVRNIGPNNTNNNTNNIEEKLGTMQHDIMQKVEEKLDEKFGSFRTVMQQMPQKKD